MDRNASVTLGDEHRKAKRFVEAIAAYEAAARTTEIPPADLCLKLARCLYQAGDIAGTLTWLRRVVDDRDADFTTWQAASALLTKSCADDAALPWKRSIRLAILSTYTTTQFAPMLRLAGARDHIGMEVWQCAYGQLEQAVLDENSDLYRFAPDVVLIAPHAGDVNSPDYADDAAAVVERELARWTTMWEAIKLRCSAGIVQHNFVGDLNNPFGHLSARLAGARRSVMHQLNAALGAAAGDRVAIVDCDALASELGKSLWFDDRYWNIAKQAVSLAALPALAQHTSAVIAATLGLTKKCLVLDLDNTLWGGVIGEDGLANIALGSGADGEAFLGFQRAVLGLKNRGVILAVCSKNNDADAREPFEKHPDMALKMDDIAMFIANWEPKPDNLRRIAETLNIGLDAMVFVDDNPAERDVVRQQLPEVDVITLPDDPSGYVQALRGYLGFEASSYTTEDTGKTQQYQARAAGAALQSSAVSIEDYWRSLDMHAQIAPFDAFHLPRIVQLIGKTNQFNLTTRRHSRATIEAMMQDDDYVHLYLKLRDRFADHGLVSLIIARQSGTDLDIDTWLMSCRVIGRTVEHAMLAALCANAKRLGNEGITGVYVPTAKNAMVADLFDRFGFDQTGTSADGATAWRYDLTAFPPTSNMFISVEREASAPQR